MHPKRALKWVAIWFGGAMLVAVGIFRFAGNQHGIEFLTCYLIEWTLSIDNLFVFLMIFRAFGVDDHRQLRALEWGIIGAIIMRLFFITLGITLVNLFEPILYVFGVILIWSAYKMAFQHDKQVDVKNNALVKWVQRRFPVSEDYVGDRFFIRQNGVLMATPLLLVVVAIESSDLMFAIDSIPAAFAITRHPMIIFTANVFAIMGLRSLYFLLAHADRSFAYLKIGVAIVLAYVGVKMLIVHYIKINVYLSLVIVFTTLLLSILLSMRKNHLK